MRKENQMSEALEDVPMRKRKKTNARRVFSINRSVWAKVCDLGIDAAASYLVIASGTGGDNRTSRWSANAVEKYSGLHNRRAANAIGQLVATGFLTEERPKEKLRIYRVLAPGEITSWPFDESDVERIWLPCSIVEGVAGEKSPVKLLRQSQHVPALHFFIELYACHDLPANCGLEWRQDIGLSCNYKRTRVGEHGQYNVWKFEEPSATVGKSFPLWSQDFPALWSHILRLGLVEFVAHLVESHDGEIMHPLPWGNSGEPEERAITTAALEVGNLMAAPWINEPASFIVPVEAEYPNVRLVGIARLKYRPQTQRTADWWSNVAKWRNHVIAFEELLDTLLPSDIKERSR
jgi:hypothetical protein